MGRRLYVGNLSYHTDEPGLRAAFASFGELRECKVITDRETGRAKGFGFVEYREPADAAKAMNAMDGADLDGRNLRVNLAEDRRASGSPQSAVAPVAPVRDQAPEADVRKRVKRGGRRRDRDDDYDGW